MTGPTRAPATLAADLAAPLVADRVQVGDVDVTELLEFLDRAHLMSCSDPSDPSKVTTYSKSAAVIRGLLAAFRDRAAPRAPQPDTTHDAKEQP